MAAPGVTAVHSVEEALARSLGAEELVAIGGAEVYRLVMPFARRIYLTHVHADVSGDTFFPDFDSTQWVDVECRAHPGGRANAYPGDLRDPGTPHRARGAAGITRRAGAVARATSRCARARVDFAPPRRGRARRASAPGSRRARSASA